MALVFYSIGNSCEALIEIKMKINFAYSSILLNRRIVSFSAWQQADGQKSSDPKIVHLRFAGRSSSLALNCRHEATQNMYKRINKMKKTNTKNGSQEKSKTLKIKMHARNKYIGIHTDIRYGHKSTNRQQSGKWFVFGKIVTMKTKTHLSLVSPLTFRTLISWSI